MLKNLIFRTLVCPFLGHARSRTKARDVPGAYTSVCKRCGVPMRRLEHNRKWVADRMARELQRL